jgi:hypothetical protein
MSQHPTSPFEDRAQQIARSWRSDPMLLAGCVFSSHRAAVDALVNTLEASGCSEREALLKAGFLLGAHITTEVRR